MAENTSGCYRNLDENNLKNQYINQSSTIEDGTLALITDKGYSISNDPDYIRVDHNEKVIRVH